MAPQAIPISIPVRFKRDDNAVFINIEIADPVTQTNYTFRIPLHTIPALGGACVRLHEDRPHEFPELLTMMRK